MKEEWRPVKDYEGIYEVSNTGRVRSLSKTIIRTNGRPFTRSGKLMKPYETYKGYLMIDLRIKGRRKGGFVHRLVADAFIQNPENKPQVNYINGDKKDNKVENLEWATNSENQKHAYQTGLKKASASEGSGRPQRKINQISINGEIIKTFESLADAMSETKIHNISAVCRGVRPLAGGYRWEFADEDGGGY